MALTLAASLKGQKWRSYLNKPHYTPTHIARFFETQRFACDHVSVCIACKQSLEAARVSIRNLARRSVNCLRCSKFPLSSHNSNDNDKYSQTSVHERFGSWTVRFTNKFSEHKASRMTYCVSSYEHVSRQKRKRIPFQTITFHFLTTFNLRRQLSSIQVR